MRCASCGLPLNSGVSQIRVVPRLTLKAITASLDERPPQSALIETETVCSEACAKHLVELWQNEELAEDIGRALRLDHWPVGAVATLIREHRDRWTQA